MNDRSRAPRRARPRSGRRALDALGRELASADPARRIAEGPPADADPEAAAEHAGLRYGSDSEPGVRRARSGNGFRYVGPDGKAVDRSDRARIRALAIPPAWTDVWISPDAHGHLQATGRDARGRKQYRYHTDWRRARDETKFGRMAEFGEVLHTLRRRVAIDLARAGLPREKVLAAVVRLLDLTLMRVGNEEYANGNGSFGLTTLRNRHVKISGDHVRFEFRGKGGKLHRTAIEDRRLARVVKRCRDIPGYELFQYVDDGGERRSIRSEDVNDYIREATGKTFTAKDFRTWAGTVLAACALTARGEPRGAAAVKRNVVASIEEVARELGNTPAVCRKSYVHPAILDAYADGSLLEVCRSRPVARGRKVTTGLRIEERTVLRILRKLMRAQKRAAAKAA